MARPKDPSARLQRQTEILEAARIIFARQGFADARMDDIANQCGLGKGTLYLYYKTKDDLIVGLLQSLFDAMLLQLHTLVESDTASVEARLLAYGDTVVHHMQADPSLLSVAYEFYAIAARRPDVLHLLRKYFAGYRQVIETLLQQGIARGEFAPFDVVPAAITFVGLMEGLTLLWFTDSDSLPLAQLLPHAIKQFLNGLT